MELGQIAGSHIHDFLRYISGYSNQTKDHMMRTVRQFMEFCWQNQYHPQNLASFAPNVHYDKRAHIPSAYSYDEVMKVLGMVDRNNPVGKRNYAKDVDLLVERYKVDVAGAYHAILQVLGEEFSQKQGTVLVTGGGLAMYPMYDYLPLSMDKAALRAMCLALHEELKKQNVYLGTVTVTGVIAPGEKCDPALLAEDFWKLYTERKDCEVVH